jgi:hypothetical protein
VTARTRQVYVEAVLSLFRRLPCTATKPRPADRKLAAELHRRGVSLEAVEIALRLAAARRMARPPQADPLPPVRSLHYFLPLLDELPAGRPPEGYLDYLRQLVPDRQPPATPLRPAKPTPPPHPSPWKTRQLRLQLADGAPHEKDIS